jgi:hypothetical protein
MANIDSPADGLLFSVDKNQNADGGAKGYPTQTPGGCRIREQHGRSDTPKQSGSSNVSTPFSDAPKK